MSSSEEVMKMDGDGKLLLCFICGTSVLVATSRGGGGGGEPPPPPPEKEGSWSDMRKLLRLLCKLMSVSAPMTRMASNYSNRGDHLNVDDIKEEVGEEEEEEMEGCWNSQACGHCRNVLVQMSQLAALLERTQKSLDGHVKQVESLIIKSGAENVSCPLWGPPFRTFRRQIIEASLKSSESLQADQVKVDEGEEDEEEEERSVEWADEYDDDDQSLQEDQAELENCCDPLSSPPPPPPPETCSTPEPSFPSKPEPDQMMETESGTTSWSSSSSLSTRVYALTPCVVRVAKLDDDVAPVVTTTTTTSSARGGDKRSGSLGGANNNNNSPPKKLLKLKTYSRKSISQSDDIYYDPGHGQFCCDAEPETNTPTTTITRVSSRLRGRNLKTCRKQEEEETRRRNNSRNPTEEDHGGDDGDSPPSGSDYAASDEDDDDDSGQRKLVGRSTKSGSSSSDTTKSKPKKPAFIPFLIADASKDLYLFCQATFVSKTTGGGSHLACHALECEFKVELTYTYTAFQEMKSHILQCHGNVKHGQRTKHPCLLCSKTFPNRLKFRAHLPHHHYQLLAGHQSGICESCLMPMRFESGGPYRNHLRLHMFTHKSDEEKDAAIAAGECRDRTGAAPVPTNVIMVQNKPTHKCSWDGCSYATKLKSHIRRHLQSHLPREQRSDMVVCEECGASMRKNSLKTHILWMHHPEQAAAKILQCGYCDRKFFPGQRTDYEAHLLVHQGVTPFICAQCGATFNSRSGLDGHIKRKHGPQRPPPESSLKCDHCDKAYMLRNSLIHHIRRCHSDVVPLKQKSKLNRVEEGEEGEEKGGGEKKPVYYGPIRRWPCSNCELILTTKEGLQRHLSEVHGL